MKSLPCYLVLALAALSHAPLQASSMGGPAWKSLQFETTDGDTVRLSIVGMSAVSIKLNLEGCKASIPNVVVGNHLGLADVGFFYDLDESGKYYLLSIPTIEVVQDKQIHKRADLYLRNCKIERIETIEE